MVVATKPGTTVPVKVLRNKQEKTLNVTVDELDLDAEQGTRAAAGTTQPQPSRRRKQAGSGFGLTLQNLTPQMARRLQLPSGQTGAVVTDVDPERAGGGRIRPGDVILSVNRKPVSNAAEAGARAAEGRVGPHRADSRLARRRRGVRAGEERLTTGLQISDCRLQM